MISFFFAMLLIFVSGFVDSTADAKATESLSSQQLTLATSTNNLTASTPKPAGTQPRVAPSATAASGSGQTPTAAAGPQDVTSPPPSVQPLATDVPPGTDAPPPPTFQSSVTDVPPGTDAPPPPIQNQPTEAPPAGNGNPPGS